MAQNLKNYILKAYLLDYSLDIKGQFLSSVLHVNYQETLSDVGCTLWPFDSGTPFFRHCFMNASNAHSSAAPRP